jgi:hypothetical protein
MVSRKLRLKKLGKATVGLLNQKASLSYACPHYFGKPNPTMNDFYFY